MRVLFFVAAILAIAPGGYAAPPPQHGTICIYADGGRSVREAHYPGDVYEFTIYVFCQPSVNGLLCARFGMKFPENITRGEVTVNPAVDQWSGDFETGITACFEECQERWIWTHKQTVFLTDWHPSEIYIVSPGWGGRPYFMNCRDDDDDNNVEVFSVCGPFFLNPLETDRTAEDVSHYELFETEHGDGTVAIDTAVLMGDRVNVNLRLRDALQEGRAYTVCIHGVEDRAGNAISTENECTFTFGTESADITPQPFELHQNFPNPFNPGTTIEFYLPAASRVRLEIFDVAGRRVATLLDRDLGRGDHVVRWDGTGASGERVRSGVYFYRLRAGEGRETRKMVLLE